jgi:hypothetical protein
MSVRREPGGGVGLDPIQLFLVFHFRNLILFCLAFTLPASAHESRSYCFSDRGRFLIDLSIGHPSQPRRLFAGKLAAIS